MSSKSPSAPGRSQRRRLGFAVALLQLHPSLLAGLRPGCGRVATASSHPPCWTSPWLRSGLGGRVDVIEAGFPVEGKPAFFWELGRDARHCATRFVVGWL